MLIQYFIFVFQYPLFLQKLACNVVGHHPAGLVAAHIEAFLHMQFQARPQHLRKGHTYLKSIPLKFVDETVQSTG